MSRLELRIAERKGGSITGRKFLDFVVDGQSLYELIGHRYDTVSSLAQWPNKEETVKALNRLLLRDAVDFPNERRSLYVCGECGGLDCGAVSLLIEEQQENITWSRFGYENSWEDHLEVFEDIGPFVFDKAEYVKALVESVDMLSQAT